MSALSAITAATSAQGSSASGPVASGPVASGTPQPRLVKAAHEFEAQMMKELLEPLNHSSSLLGADGDDGSNDGSGDSSGSSGALGEFASEALGKALSEGGGFGIATGIVKQLSRAEANPGNRNNSTGVTGNQHVNTVMSLHK